MGACGCSRLDADLNARRQIVVQSASGSASRAGMQQLAHASAHNTKLHVLAWGDDGKGQCLGGARSSPESIVPNPTGVRLPEGKDDFVQLNVGAEQSFLISRSGALWGGGSNEGGCLSQDADMVQVFGLQRLELAEVEDFQAAAVAAGRDHFVAVQEGGERLLTWGCSNEYGQTGQGSERVGLGLCQPRIFALHQGIKVKWVACGQHHSLALTERGEVFSWGDCSTGQLGQVYKGVAADAPKMESAPRRVEAGAARGLPIRQVAAGAQHSMALGISGQVLAWGCNRRGRLGLGPNFDANDIVWLPTAVADLPGVVRSLAAGGRHSAVVLRKGLVLLAGDNRCGQLGHPARALDSTSTFKELPVECSLQVRVVVAGEAHTLFLSYEGELFGVGANDRGQLGEPLSDFVDVPRRVQLPNPELIIWAVATGPHHSMVLASEPPDSHARCSTASGRRMSLSDTIRSTLSVPSAGYTPDRSATDMLVDGGPLDQTMDDEEPITRTTAYHGTSMEGLQPLEAEPEETPARLRSSGCISKLANSGKLVVPLTPKLDRTLSDEASLGNLGDTQVLLRKVTRPGVAADVAFACLTVTELADMVRALTAGRAVTEQKAAVDQLQVTMAAALKCPTVLGASFLFPSLNVARLDAGVLCEQLLEARQTLGLEAEQAWVKAAGQGLRVIAPPVGLLTNVKMRDQIRGLVVYLLVPNWPALLSTFPGGGGEEAFMVGSELLRAIARLPIVGRAVFRDIVAEECGDITVLRDGLLAAARALADASVRHCMRQTRPPPLETPMWEAVLLLQLLWLAEEQRLKIAAGVVQAARMTDKFPPAETPNRVGRSLSKTFSTFYPMQSATGVALPRACFEIQALVDAGFPAETELYSFREFSRMQVVEPHELCMDQKWQWRVDGHREGGLPPAIMSFMANGNLVPLSFKQRVLQVENMARQYEEQCQVLSQAGSIQVLPWGLGVQVPTTAVFFILQVRREHLLQDTTVALQNAAPRDLRKPLKVKFAGEEGVDEGGVAKEYFRLLSEQLFSPNFGMFKCDPDSRYIWFDPASFNDPEDFSMVGTVVGLAVYNNLPGLDVSFPMALFKKLKELPLTIEDLGQAFPSLANSLRAVLDWSPSFAMTSDPQEADELFQRTFCLDFSVSYEVIGGGTQTVNLLGGEGPAPPVTLARTQEFAELFKEWHLATGIKTQFDAFNSGFSRVCGSPVFNCLSARELEAIVCGEKDVDFTRLRKGTQVVDTGRPFRAGYLDQFWELLETFDLTQKRQFLKFVTGSDLAPVGGLERLAMKIQKSEDEPTNRLPTSHTCFNCLVLPEYESVAKLGQLLRTAIENAEGFGLE